MIGRLVVVATSTLTFVASCGAPKDTVREPQVGPGIGRPLVIDRIGPDGIEGCQDPAQEWPGEAIYDPATGVYTCERS